MAKRQSDDLTPPLGDTGGGDRSQQTPGGASDDIRGIGADEDDDFDDDDDDDDLDESEDDEDAGR